MLFFGKGDHGTVRGGVDVDPEGGETPPQGAETGTRFSPRIGDIFPGFRAVEESGRRFRESSLGLVQRSQLRGEGADLWEGCSGVQEVSGLAQTLV